MRRGSAGPRRAHRLSLTVRGRRLFELVKAASSRGTSVLFVSHDLDEVRQITDTVTVLRDGRRVGCVPTASIRHRRSRRTDRRTARGIRQAASGRPSERSDAPLCSVRGLSGGFLQALDLDIRQAERSWGSLEQRDRVSRTFHICSSALSREWRTSSSSTGHRSTWHGTSRSTRSVSASPSSLPTVLSVHRSAA